MDLSRNAVCVKCGYALQGLGAQGRCPECGAYYDADSGRGIASELTRRNERSDRAVYLIKFWTLMGAAALVLLIGMLLAWGSPQPIRPIATATLIASMFGFAAFATWFIERQQEP
jgi:hypothetical protein